MTPYRRALVWTVVLTSAAGCGPFRPIDPNPPRAARAPDPAPEAVAPESRTVAQTSAPVDTTPTVTSPAVTSPAVTTAPTVSPVLPSVPFVPVSGPAATPAAVVPPPAPREMTPLPKGRFSDESIVAMLLASNNTDISYARLVPHRAQREDVRKFAERMLTDHTGVNALVTDLIRRRDWDPKDNVVSLDLRDESANRRDIMRELSGFAFDSTYMENEIAYHQRFLAVIDEVMTPNARNDDLRNLLAVIRPAVAAHLAHAEQTRANVLAKK